MPNHRWLPLLLVMAIAPFGASVAAQPTQLADPMTVTCGDMLAALRAADPGPNPGRKRRLEAEAAQDDLAAGLYWVHGFRTGTMGEAAPALTPEWMAAEVKGLAARCRAMSPDGTLPLIHVVRP